MTKIVTAVENYDSKRSKVTLDYGEVTLLLYKGELKRLRLREHDELSDKTYNGIINDILVPRAKKRILYYLKTSDKTKAEIRRKLKQSLYPDEVSEKVMEFLDKYGFADDKRYAENLIESSKGKKSRREIREKLYQKGIKADDSEEMLSGLSGEDEYMACEKALKKKYTSVSDPADRNRAYGYLLRRGFSYDAIEHAFNAAGADNEGR